MTTRLVLGPVFALALWLVPAAPVRAEQETITKTEVRTEPPNRTHRQLRDVIWDAFEVQDYRRDQQPSRPLSSLHLRTKTHATRVPNLCRYDLLWVEFEKADPRDSGPDAPTKAVALSSSSHWTLLGPPPNDDLWHDAPVSVEACAALPEDSPSFHAPSELQAVEGYLAWIALRNDVERGRLFPLECNLFRNDTLSCTDLIKSMPLDQLSQVERCRGDYGGKCYDLTLGDRSVTLEFDTPLSGNDPKIVTAKLESLIVMVHEIAD